MVLVAGSIAFVGFSADGNDDLAFVALETIPAGTVIYFNDQEWQGTAFNTGEGQAAWTATGDIAPGTVVTINNFGGTPVSNLGTVTGGSGLGSDGEIVYAYVGAPFAPTAFLAAIANDGFTQSGGTLEGTGLVVGETAIDLSNGGANPGEDIAVFTGPRSGQAIYADYAAVINDVANWTTQDGSGDQSGDGTAPDLPFDLGGFILGAEPAQAVGFAAAAVSIAEGNDGTKVLTFTVVRTGGSSGQIDFTGSFEAGTTDAADFGGTMPTGFSGSIAAGANSATVTITISGDTQIEATEAFTLTLTGATNTLGSDVTITPAGAAATGTILNDDYGLSIGGINVYDAAESLQGSTTTPTATDDIVLVRLGSIQGMTPGAESTAFVNGKVYATNINGDAINVATVTAQGTLVNEAAISLAGLPDYKAGGVNAVAAKNGIIAVGYESVTPGQPGHVALFNAADNSLIKTITVGVLPDQLTFTPDGSKLLVANEGEAVTVANNPVGGISIIDLSGGAAAAAVATTIGFGALDGAEAALADRGLTLFPGTPASADVEPEYITVSPDGTRAYVTLQEVNAVAVIDLTDPNATAPIAIQPLGFVDRSLAGNAFDASDRDGGINIENAEVLSVLQPDAIASFAVGGATYFITANEGDSRVAVTDSVRLGDSSYVLDPTLFPNAAEMKADAELGRLNVLTNVGDTDGDGDFDVIYTLGGRGISIFRQEADGSITKVRETGGEFESIIAQNYPAIFNSNQSTAGSSADTRSDDKGPEPEGVTIGKIGDRTYAFIGLERVGGYMVYDVTDPANAFFVTYKPQTAQDLGPETSVFVSAEDSPTGQALLISGQEISNTVTLYSIQTQSENADTIQGAGDADTFFGRGGDDSISGLGGNDVLTGGLGADRLDGGDGVDTAGYATATAAVSASLLAGRGLTGEALGDRFISIENLTGSAFDDSLYGDNGTNTILGGAGNDTLYGYLGDDRLEGGAGDDLVRGGEGADTLLGGDGADKLVGDEGNDVIDGGAGSDVVYGGAGDDSIDGGADADTLRGDEANDTLTGGTGDDVLLGGDGNDVLIGGAGRDSMYGGAGADRFVFNAASESVLAARDILRDFSQTDGDLIDLSAIDSGAASGAFTLVGAFTGTAGELTATAVGAFQQVQGDVNGDGVADFTILVAAGGSSLTSADFAL
ncbi:DNA-binding beta-propeller fold protein YncE [Sphingomonas zeicaulis]|uniref:choice-of-anchor I family protein n=1 Tax=Sphingomonas zeicaulis TaxID=1632740 RepID=UPI003D20A4BB